MPKLVAFTVPTDETVYINADAVTNVHELFAHEAWADGARTAILYGDGLRVGVTEDVNTVVARLHATAK